MAKRKALEGVFEYTEYIDQLNEKDAKWVKQFYFEYEANGSSVQEEPILTTKDQLKEAGRKHNTMYRDAFNVSRNIGKLKYTEDQREIMELVADESDWELAFTQGGYEAAINLIMDQAIRDMDAGQDVKVCLSRFYIRMERARKHKRREETSKEGKKNARNIQE